MTCKHISKIVSRKDKDKKHIVSYLDLWGRVILMFYLLDDNKVHTTVLSPTFIWQISDNRLPTWLSIGHFPYRQAKLGNNPPCVADQTSAHFWYAVFQNNVLLWTVTHTRPSISWHIDLKKRNSHLLKENMWRKIKIVRKHISSTQKILSKNITYFWIIEAIFISLSLSSIFFKKK